MPRHRGIEVCSTIRTTLGEINHPNRDHSPPLSTTPHPPLHPPLHSLELPEENSPFQMDLPRSTAYDIIRRAKATTASDRFSNVPRPGPPTEARFTRRKMTDIGSSNFSVSSIFCYKIHDGFRYDVFVDNLSVSSMSATHPAHHPKNEKCNHFSHISTFEDSWTVSLPVC